jgi:Fur family transcriptional regulator, ferric uptake regulator
MKYKFGYTQIVKLQGEVAALNNSGVKATKPRQEILKIMSLNRYPMTAEMIFSKLNDKKINLTTVYRTLEIFEKSFIVKKINLVSNSTYYEISDAHHHHIICKDCGMIEEIEDCAIERMIPYSKKFAAIFDHSLEFFGRCKNCIKS